MNKISTLFHYHHKGRIMNKTKYFVVNEHTLCYQQEGMTDLGVLRASILRGSPFDGYPCPGTIVMPMNPDEMRPATKKDFEEFGVCHKGYLVQD
jgi:hypothetical protein